MPYQINTATRKISKLKKRIRAVQGGTSASKTISILLLLIQRSQTKHATKELTSVVSESIPHLKRGAMRDFKNIMKEHNYWKDASWNATDSIYTFETGNEIEFFSSDNGDKLRGARRDWLFLNECNNIKFDAFEQMEVRTKKGVYLDWNPSSEFWFYTEVQGMRDDVDHLIITYKDNESLDESIVKAIEQRKNRLGWWKVYGEGQLGEVEGKIYKNWQIIDSIPHEARLVRRGLDFGYSCFTGDTMIKCIDGDKKISSLTDNDFVLTRLGYKKVKNVFNNGFKEVVEKEFIFKDGFATKIIGTFNHNFNVNNKWKKFKDIKKKNKLYVLREKNIQDTPKATNTQPIFTINKKVLYCIGKFIKSIKEISQKTSSFIILTATLLITKFQISLLCLIQNMLRFTRFYTNEIKLLKERFILKKSDFQKTIGVSEDKKSWTYYQLKLESVKIVLCNLFLQIPIKSFVIKSATIVGNIKQKKTRDLSYAKTAIKGLWAINILNQKLAPQNVQLDYASLTEVKTLNQSVQEVYNIEVEDIHEYFANGVLVYNCDPTVIVDIYSYNGGYIVSEVVSKKGMSNRAIADILLGLDEPQTLVIADSAEPKSIDEIASYGIVIKGCVKGADSVRSGISYIQDQKISVTKSSIALIKSYRNYLWDIDRDGNILNVPNHDYSDEMDAIRYGIYYNINVKETKTILWDEELPIFSDIGL